MPRFTTAEVTPIDSTPRTAARRPADPPVMARAAAMASQSRELSAARERRRIGSSSAGVGTEAIARYEVDPDAADPARS